MLSDPEIAVIIPVTERHDDIRELHRAYRRALVDGGYRCSFTYVIDGQFPDVVEELKALSVAGEPIRVIKLTKWFGEATALTAAFEHSHGDVILTLPAYYQVESADIPKLIEHLNRCDMAIGRRSPRVDSLFNRAQTALFNGLMRFLTGTSFHDLGCGARAFKRSITTEVPIYGDQHRFFPLLADRWGFTVTEISVAQSPKERRWRVYRPGIYPRRLLDLLTVFFLIKFTKKPLRFFGLIGIATFLVGALSTTYLVVERLVWRIPLAERPALLLSSLLVVLGVQIFALGLIGELIIFTHAKDLKEYTIEEIVN